MIHNPESILFAWGQDESEGAMIESNLLLSNESLLELLYEIRMSNVNDTFLDISRWRKIENINFSSFRIKSISENLSNIHFNAIGDTSNVNNWSINCNERNFESTVHPDSTITGSFSKYRFNEASSESSMLEIIVSIADTAIFNKYIFPTQPAEGVLLGDPKANPEVTTTANNSHYGFLGCVRTSTPNCSYPDSYSYTGKNRKHDGVDITASVGENVYAIFGGVIQPGIVDSFEPQNELYANNGERDYRGLLSDQSISQPYTYTNSNGVIVNDTLPVMTRVGRYGCHYGSGSYGNYVVVRVELDKPVEDINGVERSIVFMRYAHLNTINVTSGQRIEQGDIIGIAGCSGNAARIPISDHHIHIEVNSTNNWTGVRDVDLLQLITTTITRPE
ncbi:MAG TPA: M23 family metallopeptidase [Bacteroidales bacterium]|nr:M23 family metallopeptidase [Bacteroidales bacterium]